MISAELLKILVCPERQTSLELASDELIAKLNLAVAAGTLKNRAGQPISKPLEGGLVRDDGLVLYPIQDDIPLLLEDEAIHLNQAGVLN